MYIEQIYTRCMAEASYYIESEGEVAIIDPMREAEPYLELAERRHAKIKYVFETHFHADFISGHLDIARKTDAKVIFGPTAQPNYDCIIAKDNEEFSLGEVKIKVLHTPGHTLESSCFLLMDENGIPHSVFTGDTLFVDEVGRPDLACNAELTKEALAGMLYDSIYKKLKTLPDYVIVYPGHGPGSACGKNIGTELFSTIGKQKQFNYALKTKSKEEFVREVTDGLADPPRYFYHDASINKNGYKPLEDIIEKNNLPIELKEFLNKAEQGIQIIDTRNTEDFCEGYIPGSINIALSGNYAIWAGSLFEFNSPFLLVTDKNMEKESIVRLARVGFENIIGYLDGGIEGYSKHYRMETIETIDPNDYIKRKQNDSITIDVRNNEELNSGILQGAKVIPLLKLESILDSLSRDMEYYIYCAGGYRSIIAASIMKKYGFNNVTSINGGVKGIIAGKIKLTQFS
ncbi:MAG: MBL fold metallo-hydrolase [Bacteroidota bacterium]